MASAVNFTAVAVVFKNECTRDLSLRAKSPLFGQLLVLVLVLLVVLVLVLVNMLQVLLSAKAGRFLVDLGRTGFLGMFSASAARRDIWHLLGGSADSVTRLLRPLPAMA